MTTDTFSAGARWRSLIAVTSSAMTVGLVIGLAAPLIALVLERRGVDTVLNGFNAAMPAIAIFLAGPLVPRIIARVGAFPTMVTGALLTSAMLALFPVFDSVTAWFVLRFVLGLGGSLHWITSETWINTLATEETRGRAVALYATLWGLGVAIGPQVLRLTGTEGALPFLFGAGLTALATLPLFLARGLAPRLAHEAPGGHLFAHVFRQAPMVLGAAFVCGFAETSAGGLLPLFALRIGFDEGGAVLMLSLAALGGVGLQPVIGWLADRMDRRRLLGANTLVGLACALALPAVAGNPWLLWPILFVLGGSVAAYYTLGLILLGQRFGGAEIAGANTAFIMAYTLGMVIGPTAAGAAMDAWNPHGLLAALAFVFASYYVLCMFAKRPAHHGPAHHGMD